VRGSTTGRTNVATFDACIGRGVAAIRALECQPYLNRFLCTLRQRIFNSGKGSTFPSISQEQLACLQIPLPPLPEQKRIAAILDAADALRAKRRESIEQLDSLVQATFLEMFGDPVTNPRKWPITCLRDIANDTFRNGLSPSTKGSVAGQVLTLGAITSGEFLFAERKSACFDRPAAEVQTLSERTFLICRGNGNRDLVGIGAFPDRTSADVCFPDTMIGATPDCGIVHGRYLHRVWNSRSVRTQVESMARTTNGTYKVNQQMLASVAMPLPPLDLQTRFASIVESIEQQKARLKVHLAELDTLFASLQSRAFNGELMA
jgi:type I restriction enzyme S subunit